MRVVRSRRPFARVDAHAPVRAARDEHPVVRHRDVLRRRARRELDRADRRLCTSCSAIRWAGPRRDPEPGPVRGDHDVVREVDRRERAHEPRDAAGRGIEHGDRRSLRPECREQRAAVG